MAIDAYNIDEEVTMIEIFHIVTYKICDASIGVNLKIKR